MFMMLLDEYMKLSRGRKSPRRRSLAIIGKKFVEKNLVATNQDEGGPTQEIRPYKGECPTKLVRLYQEADDIRCRSLFLKRTNDLRPIA